MLNTHYPSTILWLVGSLGFCSILWNALVLTYVYINRKVDTELLEERPLKKWVLHALTLLVALEIPSLIILTGVQLVRNYFLVDMAAELPNWLFWIVVIQNLLFYSINTMPGVILFAFCWAIKTVEAEGEDTLTESDRTYVGLDDRQAGRDRREQEQGH